MTLFKYIIIAIILFITGCKKYLAEEPRKQASVQTAEQLEALMNNQSIFVYNSNNSAINYSTDDTEIPLAAVSGNPGLTNENLFHYTFDVDQLAAQTSDAFWNGEYKKIFTANIILLNLVKVTGNESLKKQLKADAHFARAFSYWQLANHYCLPYIQANENTLGLPLKQTADYGESLVRSSLKEIYDLIENDLQEAAKTEQEDVDLLKPWRVSKKAVAAFLSRYYLFKGDYIKTLEQANLALTTTNATLVDYKILLAGTTQTFTTPPPTVSLLYCELNNWVAVKHLYWKEFFYTRFSYNSSQWNMPSTALMNLYDQSKDLRFKNFFIPNSNRRFLMLTPAVFRYTMFDDGKYIPVGPTIAEVMLNKAEAHARTGDIGNAMAAINTIRSKRMNVAVPAISAVTQDEAIARVLEERRREMPFAMRWFDIRRFSVNNYPADDVTIQHTAFKINAGTIDFTTSQTYTLAPGSKRFAVPINNNEIINSQGQITQNQY